MCVPHACAKPLWADGSIGGAIGVDEMPQIRVVVTGTLIILSFGVLRKLGI